MSITDSYFVQELQRALGTKSANSWLHATQLEMGCISQPSIASSSTEGSHRDDAMPAPVPDVHLLDAHPDHLAHRECEPNLEVLGLRNAGLKRHSRQTGISPPTSNSSSRNNSSSPLRTSGRPVTSSDYFLTHTAGARTSLPLHLPPHLPQGLEVHEGAAEDSAVLRVEKARIQRMLRAGGLNAGLIFTDAAHCCEQELELEPEAVE